MVFLFLLNQISSGVENFKCYNCGVTITRIFFMINKESYAVNALYKPPSTDVKLFLQDVNVYFLNSLCAQTEIFVDTNINFE